MKPFNLEEYLANPNRKVITRDGKNVRIKCTDAKGDCPIIGLVDCGKTEVPISFTKNGRIGVKGCDSDVDLFFNTKSHEGWINIFHGKDGPLTGNVIFASKEEAEESSRHCCGFTQGIYIISVKIEWEE